MPHHNVYLTSLFCIHVWPTEADEAAMEHVWHAIEYIGNTLIFLLAGMITGKEWYSGNYSGGGHLGHLGPADLGYLCLMFLAMTLVRGVMILLFYPCLKRMGYSTNPKDAFFMTWGGLRGAVGLALACIVKNEMPQSDPNGTRVVFLVSGLLYY